MHISWEMEGATQKLCLVSDFFLFFFLNQRITADNWWKSYSVASQTRPLEILFTFAFSLFQVQMFDIILIQSMHIFEWWVQSEKLNFDFSTIHWRGGRETPTTAVLSAPPTFQMKASLHSWWGSNCNRNNPNSFLKSQWCQGHRDSFMRYEDLIQ